MIVTCERRVHAHHICNTYACSPQPCARYLHSHRICNRSACSPHVQAICMSVYMQNLCVSVISVRHPHAHHICTAYMLAASATTSVRRLQVHQIRKTYICPPHGKGIYMIIASARHMYACGICETSASSCHRRNIRMLPHVHDTCSIYIHVSSARH